MTSPITRPWRRAQRRVTKSFVAQQRAPLMQVAKAAGAAIAAWFACLLIFPDQLPLFGAIAALLCMQENVDDSLSKGIERFIGVVLGVSVAIGAGLLFGTPSWLFVLAIVIALAIGWALRMNGPATNQIAISALLMIVLGGQELDYAWERIIETAIGAAIGVLVNAFIVAPLRISPTRSAVMSLVTHTADALENAASTLTSTTNQAALESMLKQSRALSDEREQVHTLLRSARESLRLNPRGARHTLSLAEDDQLFQNTQHIVTQVIGMARALYDGYDESLHEDRTVLGLADEMRRAAHDLRQLGFRRSDDPHLVIEPPALTKPYRIVTPHPTHWVLIGSLMEDLGRIRRRIVNLQRELDAED